MLNRRDPPGWDALGAVLLWCWFGMMNGRKPLLMLLSAAVIHEAGHLLVLKCYGVPVTGLRLTMLGAEIRTENMRLKYGQELLAVLAGPLFNFLSAGLLLQAPAEYEDLHVAAGAHLVLGIFNILPLPALDGWRVLNLLFLWRWGPDRGERWSDNIGKVVSVCVLTALAYLMWKTGGNLWLLLPVWGIVQSMKR